MRRLRSSSGLRSSCAEGADSSCCIHRVIPTKSTIRVELEQQTYADKNLIHQPASDCPKSISGLQALLEGAPNKFREAGPPSTSKYNVLWDPLRTHGVQGEQSESFLYYSAASLRAVHSAALSARIHF